MSGGPQSHGAYLGAGRLPALDGLRALAILAVIGHHVAGGHRNPVLDRGLGVTLFFVLSGYLITALLLRERRESGTVALGRFYVRRTLRIMPLYYAVLALYVVLVAASERGTPAGARFFDSLPAYLTFTSNWFVRASGQHTIFYFAWSLASQEQFYLLWPPLIRYARAWWIPPLAMGLLVLAEEGARWAVAVGHLPALGLPARLLTSIPTPICLGAIAACLLDRAGGFAALRALAGQPWSAAAWLLALALPPLLGFTAGLYLLTSVALTLLVVTLVLRPGRWLGTVLESAPARALGRVSYGVYLLHMLALNGARRLLPGARPVTLFLATTVLSAAAAAASWTLYERPIARAGLRLLAPRPAAAPPAPQRSPTV